MINFSSNITFSMNTSDDFLRPRQRDASAVFFEGEMKITQTALGQPGSGVSGAKQLFPLVIKTQENCDRKVHPFVY